MYLYKRKNNPHLFFGPLWDHDIAMNNCRRLGNITESLMKDVAFGATAGKLWIQKLWEYPWFSHAVNARWKELREQGIETFLLSKVDSLYGVIRNSALLNYQIWDIMTAYHDELILHPSYDDYFYDLRNFISDRVIFLSSIFEELDIIEQTKLEIVAPTQQRNVTEENGIMFDLSGKVVDVSHPSRVCVKLNKGKAVKKIIYR